MAASSLLSVCLAVGVFLSLSLLADAAAPKYCPPLGPVFPPPSNFGQNDAWSKVAKEISVMIEESLKAVQQDSSIVNVNSTSFSFEVFSARDSSSLLSYAYTAPTIKNATTGVRHVDKDTVFRIGSGSKLWTVLLLLKEMGDRVFSDPVGAYVPELLEAAEKFRHNKTAANDQANLVRWDEVTVGELASHMAGITRDCMIALLHNVHESR